MTERFSKIDLRRMERIRQLLKQVIRKIKTMFNLLNIYDCPKCGERLSDEIEYIQVQLSDDEWGKVPFCNKCNSEVKIRMTIDPVTKQEIYEYEEVDDERARWAHGFYDENEDEDDYFNN